VVEELGAERDAVEEALRKLENRAMSRIESSNFRVTLHQVLKHLIVTGNALLLIPTEGPARMYSLNQYCVVRDAYGVVTEAVIKETVHPSTLKEDVRKACAVDPSPKSGREEVDVYTKIELKNGGKFVEYFQEINDIEVPESRGRNKVSESPFIFLRWTAVENEDYGRGLVEEYIGDLHGLDVISKAILSFSAAAGKIVLFVHPNATTDVDALVEAESGDVITGKIEDVDVLQLDKYADFRVSKEVADELTSRLSNAFLLQSGMIRDAERVTAQEIRAMAQELEDVLGGVYTVLSRELQLPIVKRLIAQMRRAGEFPILPKVNGQDTIEPVIVTGFDALGRGHELNRLRAYFTDLAQVVGPQALQRFDVEKVAKTLATAHNVDVDGLLKDEGLIAEEQQAQMAAQIMDKAVGPVSGALAKNISDLVTRGESNG
tara:strand:- start:4884 stop:6182 length:1299 start_codon:yes stop_codon:yes gene_type:complete